MSNKATIMMNGMFTGDKIMNYSNITLGELLSSENETIKRNAMSILKQLQRLSTKGAKDEYCENNPLRDKHHICAKCANIPLI